MAFQLTTQQLGELLGRGAFGRVYKGLNFQTGEVVAVKQTRKTDLEPSQLPAIMVRPLRTVGNAPLPTVRATTHWSSWQTTKQHELELLQKLSHPHIVKFLGYYEVDDYLFFVMEYEPHHHDPLLTSTHLLIPVVSCHVVVLR